MSENVTDPAKDPHLPPMGRLGDLLCPRAPQTIAEARLEDGVLIDLAVKFAYTINRFTADWLGERLHVVAGAGEPPSPTQLPSEGLIEETMMTSGGKPARTGSPSGAAGTPSGRWRCAATSARRR